MAKEKKEPKEITGDDLKPMALLKRIKDQEGKIAKLEGERNEPKGKDKRKKEPKRDASGKWVKGAPKGESSPTPRPGTEPDTRDDYDKFYDGDF